MDKYMHNKSITIKGDELMSYIYIIRDYDSCLYSSLILLDNGAIGKIIKINGEDTNYMISYDGNIYNIKTCKKLKISMNRSSKSLQYPSVNLQLGKRGKYKTKTIHRLVANAYIENPNNFPVVDHIDGNKMNYNVNNLEWCTYSENNFRAYRTGLKIPNVINPESCNLTSHTKHDVIKVCELLESGMSPKRINRIYGYGYDFILHIRRGDTWKFISKNYSFPKIKKYSSVLSYDEIKKIEKLLESNSVKETIIKMGWEYNEINRGRVKHIKTKLNKQSL